MLFSNLVKGVVAGALLLGANLAPSTANADVIYDFNQVGLTVNQPLLRFDGNFVLSDEAVTSGRPQSVLNTPSQAPFRNNAPDVRSVDLDFTFSDRSRTPLSVDLATFTTPRPFFSSGYATSFNIVATFAGLFGTAVFNNTETDFNLTFNGTSFTGGLSSDGPQSCFFTRCLFGGNITVATAPVAVPEPASLALFGMGLLGMGMVQRRRGKTNSAV